MLKSLGVRMSASFIDSTSTAIHRPAKIVYLDNRLSGGNALSRKSHQVIMDLLSQLEGAGLAKTRHLRLVTATKEEQITGVADADVG